ncbi:hypothetical protein HDU76_008934, partial [Blyttiomyces sp. JEL0837]
MPMSSGSGIPMPPPPPMPVPIPPPPPAPAQTTDSSPPALDNPLLKAIQKGTKLKKAVTNDRSGPIVDASPSIPKPPPAPMQSAPAIPQSSLSTSGSTALKRDKSQRKVPVTNIAAVAGIAALQHQAVGDVAPATKKVEVTSKPSTNKPDNGKKSDGKITGNGLKSSSKPEDRFATIPSVPTPPVAPIPPPIPQAPIPPPAPIPPSIPQAPPAPVKTPSIPTTTTVLKSSVVEVDSTPDLAFVSNDTIAGVGSRDALAPNGDDKLKKHESKREKSKKKKQEKETGDENVEDVESGGV